MASLEEKIQLLNWVANAPEVLKNVAPGYARVDLTAFFDNPKNVMLGDQRGLVLFIWHGADDLGEIYHMHYMFTEALRGRDALIATKKAIATLFTQTNTYAIVGSTPRENRAARAMNRALGARPVGVSIDGRGRPCIDYKLERKQWAISSAVS
jgi:hypothetical protein